MDRFEAGDKAKCINPDTELGPLTMGKIYTVIDTVSETIGIIDDSGDYETHGMARFKNLTKKKQPISSNH